MAYVLDPTMADGFAGHFPWLKAVRHWSFRHYPLCCCLHMSDRETRLAGDVLNDEIVLRVNTMCATLPQVVLQGLVNSTIHMPCTEMASTKASIGE